MPKAFVTKRAIAENMDSNLWSHSTCTCTHEQHRSTCTCPHHHHTHSWVLSVMWTRSVTQPAPLSLRTVCVVGCLLFLGGMLTWIHGSTLTQLLFSTESEWGSFLPSLLIVSFSVTLCCRLTQGKTHTVAAISSPSVTVAPWEEEGGECLARTCLLSHSTEECFILLILFIAPILLVFYNQNAWIQLGSWLSAWSCASLRARAQNSTPK